MTQRDHFAIGFILGSLVGGLVGGIAGAVLASRKQEDPLPLDEVPQINGTPPDPKILKSKTKSLKLSDEERLESARRSLEDKIAQLNDTIDDVRQQLGTVEPTPKTNGERSLK